ncbi:MAG TPA: phytanoyl-CoA dioxygenase family protein [Chloroflexota bacterium]
MRLTEQQVAFFHTFGFLKFPGLLTDQIGQIEAAFEGVWTDHGGGHDGKPHDGTARSCLVPFIDQSERLSQLIDDERILGIASSLLGDDFNYCSSDGNYYVGDTGWHSDGWRPPDGYLYVKMAIYLDRLTRDTGCLRVIPGSHRPGDWFSDTLQAQVRGSADTLGVAGRDVPAMPLETTPGDLLLFNHNTKHAAFGGNDHRRMFTINLSQRYREADLPILKEQIGTRARFWLDRAYGEKMMRTAGPERLRHLEQIMANDGHLPELTRQAKQKMKEPARG